MVQGQVSQLKAAGLNVEWREFVKAHTIAEDEIGVIRDFVRAGYGNGLMD
jgi:predicted esterase